MTSNDDRESAGASDPDTPLLASLCLGVLRLHEHFGAVGWPLLTAAGAEHLHRFLIAAEPNAASLCRTGPTVSVPCILPRWDATRRRLWQGNRLLKEFGRQPAPNQIAILAAFQERNWSDGSLADPLPPMPKRAKAAKRRLHETIKNLNRGLPPDSIHFRGDGSGMCVRWEVRSNGGEPRLHGTTDFDNGYVQATPEPPQSSPVSAHCNVEAQPF